jgi:hypothetical protein
MPIFTLENRGRPLAVFASGNMEEAEEFLDEEWLHGDLMVVEHDGEPLWDGESPLIVRYANGMEAQTWTRSATSSGNKGDDPPEDFLVWLVDVTDPTDELDD